jgi:IclR family pca regulon transcriptional regulator
MVTEPHGLGLTEVARRLELPKSSAARLLATLHAEGYLALDSAARIYMADLSILELAANVLGGFPVREKAAPYLHDLARVTGFAALLGVLSGDASVTIDRVSLRKFSARRGEIGVRTPASVSSIGRILLAHASASVVEQFIAAYGLPAYTPRTIVDPAAFVSDLALIRERGYALNDEEWIPRVRSIAAPIRNFAGSVVAGVAISSQDLLPDGMGDGVSGILQHVPLLLETAETISYSLGYHVGRENKGAVA